MRATTAVLVFLALFLIPIMVVADSPPRLTAPSNKEGKFDSVIEFEVEASHPDRLSITLKAETLPAGATFDKETGKFSWKPTRSQVGQAKAVFTVSDGTYA